MHGFGKGNSIRNPLLSELGGEAMGGKKRLSLKQIERMQARERGRTEGKSRKSTGSVAKKKGLGIFPPNPRRKGAIDKLKNMKVLTPYTVASRLDLRLSAAKRFLKELEQQGTIELVSASRNLSVYKIAD